MIRYAISNLATVSTLPPPLVALFTTAHDICMWKRCQHFVAEEGAGSSLHMKKMSKLPRGGRGQGHLYAIHYLAPSPATKCPLFHKLNYGHNIYHKQITNLDRSVMPGNIRLRLCRINLAIARSICYSLSLIFPGMTSLVVSISIIRL